MHWEENGAYTGEVSAKMLKSIGVEYVILGHSERRQYFNETDETVNKKLKKAFEVGLNPIVCVGETLEEREAGKANEIVTNQIRKAFEGITNVQATKTIIAYEPIWAIGTGIIPTNSEVEEVFQLIKKNFPKNKVLYGGSANEKNIDILNQCKIIDGYLLGGISLKPDKLKIFLSKLENR